MDVAGARGRAARIASTLRRVRTGPAMRELTGELSAALRERSGRPSGQPSGVRDVCRALCEEMTARRDGRPVEVRFERFPDEIEVTGLWVEFQDFDLVIVEERAEAVQQLVILGHELWHLHAGHHHHHGAGTAAAAARAFADRPGWRDAAAALSVAARSGSRADEEAEADDFGHRLAAHFRHYLAEGDQSGTGPSGTGPSGETAAVQRTLGYRGRRGPGR
ncbi:toxin-antitoxin system, toxin component family protein [Streptomyces sp. NBC_01485]|uniref:toxin-antitoxin system, toxin component family protein n=1 Tax=Streptomyces sp. NBC_01485 TaxID=2903884 RepID=UPI002E33A9F0|nr:toxin-antitoxin system, toxin component family protein [Streptomyces sp. NBC_01485]